MKKVLCMVLLGCFLTTFAGAQESRVDLNSVNQVYFQEMTRLAFQGYGDLDYWSKQAKLIAFRSAVHQTSSAIAINSDRDHGNQRAAKFKMIVELNKTMTKRSQDFAFQGYGDTDYWSKRTKQFCTELAMHTSTLAGLSDKNMLKVLQPKIETLLRDAQNTGFSGYGDVNYWSRRCKEFATRVISTLGEMNTDLATSVVE